MLTLRDGTDGQCRWCTDEDVGQRIGFQTEEGCSLVRVGQYCPEGLEVHQPEG